MKTKLGILISGRGSNMLSLINACMDSNYPAEVAVVISNIENVKGLEIAQQHNIPNYAIPHKGKKREDFENEIHNVLTKHSVDLICLAGFLRILTDSFINKWPDQILNIHPSLLPAFKGLHIHERVLEYGTKFTGCTVHYVRPAMDSGPIIMQAVVPVLDTDTPDTLGARVLEQEHIIYPKSVQLVVDGKVRIINERTFIDDLNI